MWMRQGKGAPWKISGRFAARKKNAPQISAGRCALKGVCMRASGHFFVGRHVDDLERFGVERRIGPEGEFAEIAFLHFDEMFFILVAQAVKDGGNDDYAQLGILIIKG